MTIIEVMDTTPVADTIVKTMTLSVWLFSKIIYSVLFSLLNFALCI